LAKYLAKHVQAHGGAGLKVGIKSPGALAAFVRRLSKRTFGRHRYLAAPYSFRHQFAADRKAEKVPAGDIGAMLGHAVDRSSSGYGTSGQGKGRTLCRVAAFTATRTVRAMPVSKAASAWLAAKSNLAHQRNQSQSVSPAAGTFQRPT
jgi:hypothetical protein